jgi:hypothetical protein
MLNRLTLAAAMMLAMTATGFTQSPEDEQACTPDALNLCQQFIPDRGRVKACLLDHYRARRLSPLCHAVFARGEPPPPNPRAKR